MHKIEWKDDFLIGIPEIDRQHKRLIKLLNDLLDADNLHVRSAEVSNTLYSMIEYADVHFSTEESYMQEYEYPKLIEHKKEHTSFRKSGVQYCQDTIERQKDTPHEIITFLAEWTVNHILSSDQSFKNFLVEKKVI